MRCAHAIVSPREITMLCDRAMGAEEGRRGKKDGKGKRERDRATHGKRKELGWQRVSLCTTQSHPAPGSR